MASLEKAGVFLKRLFRHHITVPDGREVLALTWLPSLGNALDQTALLGCFCLRKVSCVNTKNLSSKRLALESESFMWEGFVRKCFMTRWSQESGDFRVRSSWQEAPSPSLTSGSPGQPLLGCHRHQSVSLEVHAAQITLEQRNRSLLQFRGRGPVPEWAVVVQTHLMSGWPKNEFEKQRQPSAAGKAALQNEPSGHGLTAPAGPCGLRVPVLSCLSLGKKRELWPKNRSTQNKGKMVSAPPPQGLNTIISQRNAEMVRKPELREGVSVPNVTLLLSDRTGIRIHAVRDGSTHMSPSVPP
uniref:uncharacterized protein LOC118551575 isoform X2 n=1 Tax=Halichoerus grypus TaxID=9711 RepID=UPI00165938B5|nr:uncharacterized protein LOC118551575 isoform X2 [Halichoerus grypus]